MVFLYTVSKTSSCSQRYTVLPDEEVVQSFLYLQELQSEHLYFRYFMSFFDVFSKNASLYPPGHVYSSVLVSYINFSLRNSLSLVALLALAFLI